MSGSYTYSLDPGEDQWKPAMELQEKIDWLDGAIWSRTEWLEAHGAKQK